MHGRKGIDIDVPGSDVPEGLMVQGEKQAVSDEVLSIT